MMFEAYVVILAVCILFLRWQQREESRVFVALGVTGIFASMCVFFDVNPIVWDGTTISVAAFSLWACFSLLWSHSRQSKWDLSLLITSLILFLIARHIDFRFLMVILFLPGLVFAVPTIIFRNAKKIEKRSFIYGNLNHTGASLIIPFFTGIWLTFNVSWWILPLVLVLALAIAMSMCRGAQLGTLIGLTYIASTENHWMLMLIPVIMAGTYFVRKGENLNESSSGRISIWLAGLHLIAKKPFSGYGLRTFRREYPVALPWLRERYPSLKFITSHRIHNDYLELIFELGFVGYFLFLNIFSNLLWAENPLLSGAIIAFAVHGLFFFPLREAHTAFPFWVLAGAMAGSGNTHITISFVAIIIAIKVVHIAFIKTLGLFYFDKAEKIVANPDAESESDLHILAVKQRLYDLAIECDPYNNTYLTHAYYYNVFRNPGKAFQYASRCMENYDGGKTRWGVCDQYARALLRFNQANIAKSALNYALKLNPEHAQSTQLLQNIAEMEAEATKLREKMVNA